jgi:AcrR family transcriptional regulator
MPRTQLSVDPPISKTGAKVREQLIEAAGEVFAEKGFQGATSREICLRAGVNLAAVNYHFGGFETLYIATLKAAHERYGGIGPQDFESVEGMSPRETLKIVLRDIIGRLSQPTANSWETRLVARELVIPTFAQAEFIASSIEPRRAFFRSILGGILGLPPGDPLVGRCLLTTIAPFVMMSVSNRAMLENLLPNLESDPDTAEALVDHVERFVLAGLDAIVSDNAEEKTLV